MQVAAGSRPDDSAGATGRDPGYSAGVSHTGEVKIVPMSRSILAWRRGVLACCLTLALLTAGTAAAACRAELADVAAGLPPDMPLGSFAAQLLYGAVEIVEPALPPWRADDNVPLGREEAGYGAVRYLQGRDLLVGDWDADDLSVTAWREMIARFLAWYDLPPLTAQAPDAVTRETVLDDLVAVLDEVGAAVRPLAIIASEQGEAVFVGLLWNWTVYPRLLVLRPADASLNGGPDAVLAAISNCAVAVESYATAPMDTAWRLFAGNADATMYVIGSDPDRLEWPLPVPSDDVMPYFTFEASEVRGVSVYASVFDGQQVGLGTILSFVTQVRTNIPVTRLASFLAVPDR